MMGGVAPPKGHLVIGERDQAMIGDGYAVGIRAQITEHLLGSAKGWFAVNHPIRLMQLANETLKEFGVGESSKQAMKLQLAGSVSLAQRCDEFAAEDFAEDRFGEEETGIAQVHREFSVAVRKSETAALRHPVMPVTDGLIR